MKTPKELPIEVPDILGNFLTSLWADIAANQKIAGDHIEISRHYGEGTVIDAFKDLEGMGEGACCGFDASGNSCQQVATEVECDGLGGLFLGFGTNCATQTCQEFDKGGGGVSVVCDTVSASLSKCGAAQFTPADPILKIYRTRATTVTNYRESYGIPPNAFFPPCVSTLSRTHTETWTQDLDDYGSCTKTDSCSGTCQSDSQAVGDTFPAYSGSGSWDEDCVLTQTDDGCFSCMGNEGFCEEIQRTLTDDYYFNDTDPCHHNIIGGGDSYSSTEGTLSDEYTTGELISNTKALYPEYDNDYNDTCVASYYLDDSEQSLSIQKFIPRFDYTPETFAFWITYIERLDNGVDTFDTQQRLYCPVGSTVVYGAEVEEPEGNGTITIENIKTYFITNLV
jgi:hypothetical protein